ncbi:hypothetical protein AAG906_039600 [Vitis piasezkii]
MFVDGSSYVSFPRPFIICIHELCVIVFSIITFIDDVTSLYVGFERIITSLRVLCFTIILVFVFDSSIVFHPLSFSYNNPFPDHLEAMGLDVVFDSPHLDRITHLMIDDLVLSDFMIYHTFDVILGHVSFLSVSDHFRGLRVVAARYTGAYLPIIISLHFQFDIQSHHVSFPFGVQSRIFILAFRVIIASQFQRLEPSLPLSFNIQNHHRFSVSAFRVIIASQFWRSKPSSLLSFGIQSHHYFSVSVFRATIASQFQRSEPLSLLNFGIQSHHRFSVLAFRVIIPSQFQRFEPPSLLSFCFQSHHRFSISAFRAIIASQFRRLEPSPLLSFSVQSHHRFSVSTFRTIIDS